MSLNTLETDQDAGPTLSEIEEVLRELTVIRAEMVAGPSIPHQRLDEVHAHYRASARNLLSYLALRRRDLRSLQVRLAALGLSSLGRAESHVLATVDAVLEVLHRLAGSSRRPRTSPEGRIDFADGRRLLNEHTAAL